MWHYSEGEAGTNHCACRSRKRPSGTFARVGPAIAVAPIRLVRGRPRPDCDDDGLAGGACLLVANFFVCCS